MRKKIREIINKEEGFTLVELLAVIVILGIIVAIAIPAVGSVIDRAQGDADEAEQALVEDAARLYFTTSETEDNWVDIGTLKNQGYLEERSDEEENLPDTAGVERVPTKGTGENAVTTYTYEYNNNKPTSGQ